MKNLTWLVPEPGEKDTPVRLVRGFREGTSPQGTVRERKNGTPGQRRKEEETGDGRG